MKLPNKKKGRSEKVRKVGIPKKIHKKCDTGDDSPMTEKDSDYVKTPKVWSRELRNRFIISSGKRSLRFNNSDGSRTRNLRSCRMSVLSRSAHYSLSQSDDDEDDDDDDDERMFSSRKLRPCQLRMRHSVRMTSQDSGGRMGHSRSNPSSSQVEDGIRRSTRVRKLKYDNYSDSWIVGSQTLRGYPSYGGASYPTSVKSEVKQEESGVEEIEDEEEEEGGGTETVGENGEVKMRSESGSKQAEMPKQKPQVKKKKEDVREDEPVEGSSEAGEEGDVEETYQDMYARVKRRRTQSHNKSECSTDSDSMSEEEQPRRRRQRSRAETKYHLRQTKPTVDRFQAAAEPDKRSSGHVLREVLTSVRKRRRRSSTSSSDTSSSDERFDRKKAKAKSRNSCAGAKRRHVVTKKTSTRKQDKVQPVKTVGVSVVNRVELCGGGSGETGNGGGGPGGKTGSLLADVRPVVLDSSIRFTDVGGLERHVTCLKEMVVFPMLYSEVFARFGVTPPKGVLFHGPPGTGKTLVARALANECSLGERKVSFFMRKGADCLSKWVGESERQLRLLFEEAKQSRPSIIFFDELDGLAPVRSSRQDQIHASIVCTLLALMDGLDNRGDIVVIGATNRIDSIDPALRRPGRFDRELHFPLPGVKERLEILNIHTREWGDQEVLTRMAELSAGYCGSDLKALCTEAVLQALKRVYPQIYTSDQKLLLNPDRVKVLKEDFEKASRGIVPASRRAAPTLGRKLPVYLEPLLVPKLNNLLKHVLRVFPAASNKEGFSGQMVRSPRLLLVGRTKETSLLIAGLLYKLEKCQVHSLGLEALYSDTSTSPEEKITKVFKELPHSLAAVLWFGDINMWWNCIADSAKAVFMSLVSLLDPALPVLFIATSASSEIPLDLQSLFSQYRGEVHQVGTPTIEQREAFFRPLFRVRALRPPPPPKPKKEELEPLAVAPPPPPPKLSQDQLNKLYHEEENTLRELRIFLRQICAKLARNKQFYMFSKPVDIAEVPDYLQIIKEPMDLETMMTKIDLHKYTCAQDFLNDVDLLCRNALEYNPDRDPADKLIRHRACYLRDTAYALIKAEMDSDFEDNCRSIRESRRQREAEPAEERFAREFFPNDQLPGTSEEAAKAEVKKVELKKEEEELTDAGEKTEVVTPNNSVLDSSAATTVGSAPSIEVKKRKRKQAWSRGCVAKRTPKPKTTPTPPSDLNKSLETSIMTNGIGGPSEEDEDSKTEATDKTNTPLATENPETPDQTPKTSGNVLEVDRVGLSELVTDTVAATEGRCSLDALIDLYSILRRIINSYARKWDRKNLVPELKKELVRFAEEYSQDDEEEVRVEEEEILDDTDAVANLDLSES